MEKGDVASATHMGHLAFQRERERVQRLDNLDLKHTSCANFAVCLRDSASKCVRLDSFVDSLPHSSGEPP